MSEFITAFNFGNDAFAEAAAEDFIVVRGANAGTYAAVNIDDMSAQTAVQPGGIRSENNTTIFISRAVYVASAMAESAVLVVRNKRVRVNSISDEGDNTLTLICGSAGVKM